MSDSPRTRMSAARLDELRARAQHARQRYDLYRAKTYGPRVTSLSRLRELEGEFGRAEASLRFAEAEARRDAADAAAQRKPTL